MPAQMTLSHETDVLEVLAFLWAAEGHVCRLDRVRQNVMEALVEMKAVEIRGDTLVLTDKGVRQGKHAHDASPPAPYWMLDTTPTDVGGTGLFHAFESYLSAYDRKPVLCGRQLATATDFVMPCHDSQKCKACIPLAAERELASRSTQGA